jgi:hypothetical protein
MSLQIGNEDRYIGSGELLTDTLAIVVMNEQSKNNLMKPIRLGKRQGLTNESS